MAEIVLTSDRTLMSDYHRNEFLGFGTCAPPNFIPDWLFGYLFFPPIKSNNGYPSSAPYGLRKIEAQLLKEGFKVVTVSPSKLTQNLSNAKVLGVYTMDPFGLGPASTTLAFLFKKEPYLAKYFHALLGNSTLKKEKNNGLKVIIGGPGAWQFRCREKAAEDLGIDCVVEGEAENVIGKLFRAAMNGEEIPSHYEVGVGEAPSLDQIPDIAAPSVNGLVEIGRGCCRGCKFCNVTLRPLRWYPIEKIKREIDVNHSSGKEKGACLHAEDVMLYGSKNTSPDEEKLLALHEMVMSKCDTISWSHCSLAAVSANPKLFSKVAELVNQKQDWWGAEVGIETGSAEIAKKIMPAKAHPFQAENWHEVVVQGMGLMHDNRLVPACTLILGLPDEHEEDVLRTMELLDDLRGFRSLIVPLFFVPLGRLKNKGWFNESKMSRLHRELLFACAEHDFFWVDNLLDWTFKGKAHKRLMGEFYKGFAAIAKYKVRQIE